MNETSLHPGFKETFSDPWSNPANIAAEKRLHVTQKDGNNSPDQFIGWGKDRSCILEGSWWGYIRLATSILAHENTHRIVAECDGIPNWVRVRDIPSVLAYRQEPYGYEKPYCLESSSRADNATEHVFQFEKWPDTTIPTDSLSMEQDNFFTDWFTIDKTRPQGTWWEWVCLAIAILDSENTQTVIQHSGADLPERLYTGNRDRPLLDSSDPPYEFVPGVGNNIQTSERFGY